MDIRVCDIVCARLNMYSLGNGGTIPFGERVTLIPQYRMPRITIISVTEAGFSSEITMALEGAAALIAEMATMRPRKSVLLRGAMEP